MLFKSSTTGSFRREICRFLSRSDNGFSPMLLKTETGKNWQTTYRFPTFDAIYNANEQAGAKSLKPVYLGTTGIPLKVSVILRVMYFTLSVIYASWASALLHQPFVSCVVCSSSAICSFLVFITFFTHAGSPFPRSCLWLPIRGKAERILN